MTVIIPGGAAQLDSDFSAAQWFSQVRDR